MKILVFCPTYRKEDGALAIEPETGACLDALEHGKHAVTLEISVDESADRRKNVFKQYQRAWKLAQEGDYDALLTVEHDMVIPADALIKLAATGADIAYGVYLFRESGMLNALKLSDDVTLDRSLDSHPEERAEAFAAGGPWPVSGAGFGCTLIRSSVFTKIALRQPRGGAFPDLPLARDTYLAGLKQTAHFGVICGHIRPDHLTLYPDPKTKGAEPYTLPCRARSSFTAEWDGRRYFIGQGSKREIPAQVAAQLAQLGLVELLA